MASLGQQTPCTGQRRKPSFLFLCIVGSVVVSLTGCAVALYLLRLRPWLLHWGSTATERDVPLPGDDIVPAPTHVTTRAITIQAPPHGVWPWLMQMGQDRAGFYTHNWVERLLGSGIPDVHALHPEWQELRVGDLMRTNRELRSGHPLGWTVVRLQHEPERTLVLWSRSFPVGTYAFVLRPLSTGSLGSPGNQGTHQTRLLVRDRAVWRWWQTPFRLLIFEPLHGYMQTGQLQGIKQRAEHHAQQTLQTPHAQQAQGAASELLGHDHPA